MKNIQSKMGKLLQCVFLSFVVSIAQAATIARVGSDELVNNAELIFDGVVLSIHSERIQNGYIYSFVDFRVDDVLVGSVQTGSTLTLRFTGGTVDGVSLDVGVILPELNERGVYFVEKVAPGLINPLLGWSQGHFTVNDDGQVVAANNLSVQSVESRSSQGQLEISDGLAAGILTSAAPLGASSGQGSEGEANATMSVEEFKNTILSLKR